MLHSPLYCFTPLSNSSHSSSVLHTPLYCFALPPLYCFALIYAASHSSLLLHTPLNCFKPISTASHSSPLFHTPPHSFTLLSAASHLSLPLHYCFTLLSGVSHSCSASHSSSLLHILLQPPLLLSRYRGLSDRELGLQQQTGDITEQKY